MTSHPVPLFVVGVLLGAAAVTAIWLRADRPRPAASPRLTDMDAYCARWACHHLRANHPLASHCAIPGCSCEEFATR